MMTPRSLSGLPASYEDCVDLMCRAFKGYQPTDAENLACSQLRGTFEGKSFSPTMCYQRETQATPVTVNRVAEVSPTVSRVLSPTHGGSGGMTFGWRPELSCYRRNPETETCPSPTWFYVLLGVAAVAGLAGRQKK